jgi:23S rRNA (adenine-N6)-dimethyltransferase
VNGSRTSWSATQASPRPSVVEIGAGRGRLTEPLARKAGSVTAIEIDPELAEELRHTFHDEHHVRIVCGDVMRVPRRTIRGVPSGTSRSH